MAERGRQDWVEGEVRLQCSRNKGLSPPRRELCSSRGSSSGSSSIEARGPGLCASIFARLWEWTGCAHRVISVGKAALDARRKDSTVSLQQAKLTASGGAPASVSVVNLMAYLGAHHSIHPHKAQDAATVGPNLYFCSPMTSQREDSRFWL